MQPTLRKKAFNFLTKTCPKCKGTYGPESFSPTSSAFYLDGVLPLCDDCIEEILQLKNYDWEIADKVCQWADIPFVPTEFERIHRECGEHMFHTYAAVFQAEGYKGLGWGTYFKEFKRLEEENTIKEQLPEIGDEEFKKLQSKWGENYSEEELHYLEDLYNGLLTTQNVSGALQQDQAVKICKISLELDRRIRAGEDFDKLMASYDKMVKTAEFTPKNVKNASDFDSVGELYHWLEKRGWRAKYFDGVTKDIVDETVKNIQNYNQRLYINESGIGDEISRRIEALKASDKKENYYDSEQDYDLDNYDNAGYEKLIKDNDTFESDVGEDVNRGTDQ